MRQTAWANCKHPHKGDRARARADAAQTTKPSCVLGTMCRALPTASVMKVAESARTVLCGLMLVRIEDGGRRRGALVDRAGSQARVLDDRDGVVILAATGTTQQLDDMLHRLRGFEISNVVRSEPLSISGARLSRVEVVSGGVGDAAPVPLLEQA